MIIETNEIIEHIQYISDMNSVYRNESYQLTKEIRLIKKAIERAGLKAHIDVLIKEIEKEEENELPF